MLNLPPPPYAHSKEKKENTHSIEQKSYPKRKNPHIKNEKTRKSVVTILTKKQNSIKKNSIFSHVKLNLINELIFEKLH